MIEHRIDKPHDQTIPQWLNDLAAKKLRFLDEGGK